MSGLGARLGALLDLQRKAGNEHDRLLRLSNDALDEGDLAAANLFGTMAQQVMVGIRIRTREIADLLDDIEHSIDAGATSSAPG